MKEKVVAIGIAALQMFYIAQCVAQSADSDLSILSSEQENELFSHVYDHLLETNRSNPYANDVFLYSYSIQDESNGAFQNDGYGLDTNLVAMEDNPYFSSQFWDLMKKDEEEVQDVVKEVSSEAVNKEPKGSSNSSLKVLEPRVAASTAGGYVKPVPMAAATEEVASTNQIDDKKDTKSPLLKRIWLSNTVSTIDQCGFWEDFTSLGLLLAYDYTPGKILPLIDARAHALSDGSFAANAGIVARYIPKLESSNPYIWGLNAFYDYRETDFDDGLQQIGIGAEFFSKNWEIRVNGYIPIVDKNRETCMFTGFLNNYYVRKRSYETAFYGFNGEVGYYVHQAKNWFIFAAAGPYYWTSDCQENNWGGMLRVRPQYKDYIAIDLKLSNDRVFDTVFQAEVILSLPLYQFAPRKNPKNRSALPDRQIYQRVERFDVMPYDCCCCWTTNFPRPQ